MRASDLMIGDWIKSNKIVAPFQFMGVNPINLKDFIFVLDKNEIKKYPVTLDDVEPILLTPYILKKNGFILDTYDGSVIRWWVKEDFGFGEHGQLSVGNGRCWQNTDIKYVHELQHALKLCGIEKEIVL